MNEQVIVISTRLAQGSANFYYKGLDITYSRLCRPAGAIIAHFCLCSGKSALDYINEWAWLCSSKTSNGQTWPLSHSLLTLGPTIIGDFFQVSFGLSHTESIYMFSGFPCPRQSGY